MLKINTSEISASCAIMNKQSNAIVLNTEVSKVALTLAKNVSNCEYVQELVIMHRGIIELAEQNKKITRKFTATIEEYVRDQIKKANKL